MHLIDNTQENMHMTIIFTKNYNDEKNELLKCFIITFFEVNLLLFRLYMCFSLWFICT